MRVQSRNMNATPLAVAVLIVGAVFFTPVSSAHADDGLPPWTAEMQGEPWLDCDAAMWYVETTHYYAEQTAPDVYADPIVTTTLDEWGAATGDSPDSDCPNWVINPDDGSWSNTGAEVFPPALPLDPLPPDPVHVADKAGLEVVWKFGLAQGVVLA